MNKVLNIERFEQEFDDPEKTTNAGKPEEYQEIFAGNIDDSFRLGVRLNMNKGLCLYSEFYNSDIIVASPLGLKLSSENSSGSKGAGTSKSGSEYDYLSSIEVLVMDQCDAFLMQNWEHVLSILQKINNVPKKIHPSTDFSRVQSYFLDANSKYFRQNLLFTDYFTPEILSIFNSTCENINGKYKVASLYSTTNSSINHVTTKPLPQVFYKIPSPLVSGSDPEKQVMPTDQRFNYFCQNFSKLLFVPGTFVFVSSYFDYVRVRNYINHITENPSSVFKRFVSREELIKSPAFLNEYTSKSNVSRFRSHFFHGNSSVMLYSERFHYYYRYKIRGIKQIIFYSLPEHPQYYPEIVNLLESDTTSNLSLSTPRCHVLFDTLDSLRLERIIGSSETSNILSSFQSKFTFV
ncbi:U3 small nucleolar RNA-associated protein 25 [Zancudomyces culisetae]|uniref:U3 small nucleolar RNA-associated protein 25 n=1 Tax=Zancudomyces culisetae TaxID=1213189 RepID=A0A1R1PSD9_ZANCU|nr:U3 small nucleolar RNA-associated protein 25 [Zancudomyces culisetae]|eukprot:OMH83887.1 U3 small nucleolar RNA-associated protein 25 [Zancudomyces culisetae]